LNYIFIIQAFLSTIYLIRLVISLVWAFMHVHLKKAVLLKKNILLYLEIRLVCQRKSLPQNIYKWISKNQISAKKQSIVHTKISMHVSNLQKNMLNKHLKIRVKKRIPFDYGILLLYSFVIKF